MDGDQPFEHSGDIGRNLVSERLRKREEARLVKISKEQKNDFQKEKKDFEIDFQQLQFQIKLKLENADKMESDRNSLMTLFETIRNEMQNLHRMVADAASFLTTYEKRMANDALSALQEIISSKEDELLPKKKFTFKSRKKDGDKQQVEVKLSSTPANQMLCESLSMAISLSDLDDQTLEKQPEDVNGKDVEISRLTNCTVRIFGHPSTVHITSLKNCDIFLGPVSTSVFVNGCESGRFTLACQQLRVHCTRDVTFLVHITSRSIIEECSGIKFAKYNWIYPDLDDHFRASGLNHNINNWNLVDDFNWLSSEVASPNWALVEKEEIGVSND